MRIGIPELRRLFAAWCFHRQHSIRNHIRSVDRATIKFGRDLAPDSQHGGILIEAAPGVHPAKACLLALLFTRQSVARPIRHRSVSVPRPLVSVPWRVCVEGGRLIPRVIPNPVSTRGAVGLVHPISVCVRLVRSIPVVTAVLPAVVAASIGAPLCSPMNARNAHWG